MSGRIDTFEDLAELQSTPTSDLGSVIRYVLSATGAFLLSVYPGVFLVADVLDDLGVAPFVGVGKVLLLCCYLAMHGSLVGIIVYRLLSWSEPNETDAALVIGNGGLFGLLGFLNCVALMSSA